MSDRFYRLLAGALAITVIINFILYVRGCRPRYRIPAACTLTEIDQRPAEISILKFVCYPKIKPGEVEDGTR